jgi:signal transduction histidine kinase
VRPAGASRSGRAPAPRLASGLLRTSALEPRKAEVVAGSLLSAGSAPGTFRPVALAFQQRIFAWLVTIAVIPAAIALLAVVLAPRVAAPIGGAEAWERAATTWQLLRHDLRALGSDAGARARLHEEHLALSLQRARQAEAIRGAFSGILAAAAIALTVLVGGGAVRLAGHLSRQLSRPIDELVQWTRLLQRGAPLPDDAPARGAPEFDVLRAAFRQMAGELATARARAVEAAELRAFRELAAQVAHELKNPLTPMRFAIARLAREATSEQRELIAVLDAESTRLEQMARDFADLGRLPEGPPALVDLAELCETIVTSGAPEGVALRVESRGAAPVLGHYEPLRRAVHNLVLNAIDAVASAGGGEVVLTVAPAPNGTPAALLTVRDTGPGIPREVLPRIFEPYYTTKPRGTGLGLALVRQTIHHHGGTINVASEPGRTIFTITLPVGAP